MVKPEGGFRQSTKRRDTPVSMPDHNTLRTIFNGVAEYLKTSIFNFKKAVVISIPLFAG
ncbi:MAG: hypothetical protein RIG68_23910 [Imperialibacter sp.]|uniref:hypothetical protein n=1 Tax=Imperialibacter sp. TaxID=2038411 RepID=UPI0032EB8647